MSGRTVPHFASAVTGDQMLDGAGSICWTFGEPVEESEPVADLAHYVNVRQDQGRSVSILLPPVRWPSSIMVALVKIDEKIWLVDYRQYRVRAGGYWKQWITVQGRDVDPLLAEELAAYIDRRRAEGHDVQVVLGPFKNGGESTLAFLAVDHKFVGLHWKSDVGRWRNRGR